MNIVEVGSLNMDLVVRIPNIPQPGETLMGGVFHTYPGGKGGNQAVAAARMGARVHMVGCVGEDPFGVELCANLNSEGIDSTHVTTRPQESTGVALIQVDAQGQNSIALASGANMCLSSDDVERALQAIGEFDALAMPLEIPLEAVITAARIAARKGARVILNPAPARKLDADLLSMVDVLVPNEHEIGVLSDVTIRSDNDLHRAAEELHAKGLKELVVTLGGRGAFYSSMYSQEKLIIPALEVEAVDTTAAGDCFIGALTVALCEGMNMISAIEFASAAAAISITRFGAQPSLPCRNEVEELIQERGRK